MGPLEKSDDIGVYNIGTGLWMKIFYLQVICLSA